MRKYDGMSVALGAPDVTITAEEFREYRELQAKRDRSLLSLQAQMKLQEAEWSKAALTLARAIASGMIGDGKLGVTIVNQESAKKAYALAEELLKS